MDSGTTQPLTNPCYLPDYNYATGSTVFAHVSLFPALLIVAGLLTLLPSLVRSLATPSLSPAQVRLSLFRAFERWSLCSDSNGCCLSLRFFSVLSVPDERLHRAADRADDAVVQRSGGLGTPLF